MGPRMENRERVAWRYGSSRADADEVVPSKKLHICFILLTQESTPTTHGHLDRPNVSLDDPTAPMRTSDDPCLRGNLIFVVRRSNVEEIGCFGSKGPLTQLIVEQVNGGFLRLLCYKTGKPPPSVAQPSVPLIHFISVVEPFLVPELGKTRKRADIQRVRP